MAEEPSAKTCTHLLVSDSGLVLIPECAVVAAKTLLLYDLTFPIAYEAPELHAEILGEEESIVLLAAE